MRWTCENSTSALVLRPHCPISGGGKRNSTTTQPTFQSCCCLCKSVLGECTPMALKYMTFQEKCLSVDIMCWFYRLCKPQCLPPLLLAGSKRIFGGFCGAVSPVIMDASSDKQSPRRIQRNETGSIADGRQAGIAATLASAWNCCSLTDL